MPSPPALPLRPCRCTLQPTRVASGLQAGANNSGVGIGPLPTPPAATYDYLGARIPILGVYDEHRTAAALEGATLD